MDFLSKITGFFGAIPWVKIGIFTAVISGVVYGVHVIKLSGEQAQEIIQMKKDTEEQHRQDAASIQALKDQYARDTQAMQNVVLSFSVNKSLSSLPIGFWFLNGFG